MNTVNIRLTDRIEKAHRPYFKFKPENFDGDALTAEEFDALLLKALQYFNNICPTIGPKDLTMEYVENENDDGQIVVIGVKMFAR